MIDRLFMPSLLVGCCFFSIGCGSKADIDAPQQPDLREFSSEAALRTPLEPSLRYVPLETPDATAQAVVVQGYPLVHTRQLLPLGQDGKLVGRESPEQQVDQVMRNLETVLENAGSGLDRLVRLHAYADSPQTCDLVRAAVSGRTKADVGPAVTAVVTPLREPGAMVAVDAVAVGDSHGDAVALQRCAEVAGDESCADAAIMPRGGVVYLSGQPDKSPLAQAADKSLATLLGVLQQLSLDRSQVVQLKAFVQPAAEADQVTEAVKRAFPDQLAPPLVFVEWIASAPVEIEMVVSLPLSDQAPADTVRFYNPPEVKPSPTFSRVAVVNSEQQIFIPGLSARTAGDGQAQVRDVFEQLKSILSSTGSDLLHLAKATYYVSDEDASTMLNELRPEYYDPQRPPAASKVMVHGVGKSQRTFTMDMIAVGKP